MKTAFECLQQAGECLVRAAVMEPGKPRSELLQLTEDWIGFAQDASDPDYGSPQMDEQQHRTYPAHST